MKRTILLFAMIGFVGLAEDYSQRGNISLFMENDVLSDRDYDYTNGVALSYISPDIESWNLPDWVRRATDWFPAFNRPGYTNNLGLKIGQDMFTPTDIEAEHLLPDDRPYAGWLYVAGSLHHKNDVWLHKLELILGMLGPSSRAEDAQKTVHEWIDSREPKGWDNQLKDEPGVILSYQLKHRRKWNRWLDTIPAVQVNAGNVLTSASVSCTVRAGWNLPEDFHSNRIGSSGYAMPTGDRHRGGFGIWVFATPGVHVIARDIFLDGNTWRGSHSVDKYPVVGDIEGGVGIRWNRWTATYTQVLRSKQYRTQTGSQVFGSIGLSAWF